ncbi:MAG: O-antigen ligase family protein [Parahaliea sp.]
MRAEHSATMPPPTGPFDTVGYLLVLTWTLTRPWNDSAGDLSGQLFALLASGWIIFRGRHLHRCRALQLLALALLIQLASWGLGHLAHPELAERSPKLDRLASWFVLLPVALFCARSRQRVWLCWGGALAVQLLCPWLSNEGWAELQRGFAGERVLYGPYNAQHNAMLFGLGLLATLLLPLRWGAALASSPPHHGLAHRLQRSLPGLLTPALVAATALGVVLTQTRGIWLGLAIALPLALLLRQRLRHGTGLKPLLRPLGWLTLAGALVAATPLGGIVKDRVLSEGLPAADGGYVLHENVRVRLATWQTSIDWIARAPLLGWGGGGRAAVVQDTPGLSAVEKERFRHLHSSYLDVLVNWGLAGLALMLGLFAWLSQVIWRAWQRGAICDNLLVFWVSFLLYWLVVNSFESFMFYQSGQYVFALLGGGYLALCSSTTQAHDDRQTA